MSDYHINVFYSDEDGGYIADVPDLESCSAFGATPRRRWRDGARQEGVVGRRTGCRTAHSRAAVSAGIYAL